MSNLIIKMKQKLLAEISTLIRKIETEYPELYQHLYESPLTIPGINQANVDNEALENYLQTLKDMLKPYKKSPD